VGESGYASLSILAPSWIQDERLDPVQLRCPISRDRATPDIVWLRDAGLEHGLLASGVVVAEAIEESEVAARAG
jgi:hypothetical protein